MSFVGLHIHSDYSLLDGASQLPQLIDRAVKLGMPAIALTDHGVMYGAIQLIKLCRNKGIKPIIGNEMYIINGDVEQQQKGKKYHQIVLAKNSQGYKNLVKLTTHSHLKGFQGKGIFGRPCINKELLEKHHEGLIVTSGCLAGEIPQNIMQGKLDEARKIAKWYKDLFGEDYYLEIQDHGSQEDRVVNTEIVKIAKKLNIKIVATNDSHFIDCKDVEAHDALLCINTQKLIVEEKRMRYSGTEYLKSAEEMKQLFRDHLEDSIIEEAIANTLEVESKVKTYEGILGEPRIPDYPIPPEHNANTYLEKLAWEGLLERLKLQQKSEISQTYKERMETELKILQDQGFSTYFLVVWDYIKHARDHNIPVGPGRGSAAGSLVAYSLRITNIDPVHHGLLFERFLNPERKSMPDIDTDFCIESRDEMIKYVTERYGEARVAQIITFNRMTSKAVLKDVARVLGVPYGEANKMAKMIPVSRGKPAKLEVMISDGTPSPEFKEAYEKGEIEIEVNNRISVRQWLDMAIRIEGTNRSAGVHAAGVVISKERLDEIVPLQKNNDGTVITQYFMEDLESLGLLKMDFLGLKNLTIIQKTADLIDRNRHFTLIPDDLPIKERKAMEILAKGNTKKIPEDIEKTYKLLREGDLEGVFQLESSGMVDVVKKLKPTCIEDISSILALYRPGPLDAGLIPIFIDRKHEQVKIEYQHPKLEPILKETYGVLCLPKGTLIDKPDGSREAIENVKSGEVILTSDGRKVWGAKVAKQWRSGVKEILKITLSSGTVIYSGKNHRFLTPEGDKFAWELKPTVDGVKKGHIYGSAVYEKWPISSAKKTFRKNEAYLLGLLVGNGDIVSSTINIACSTEKGAIWVANLISETWAGEAKYYFDTGCWYAYSKFNNQLKATPLTEFMDSIYGGRSWQVKSVAKHLPEDILDYSEKDRIDLLRGLWDSDGCYSERLLDYRSSSPRLLAQIGKLLGSLKISYYLADNYVGVSDRSRFISKIGSSQMPHKQQEEVTKNYLPISYLALATGLEDSISQTDSWMRKMVKGTLQKANLFRPTNSQYKTKLENWDDFYREIYEKTYLQDARLVDVVSVEEAGEAECFDLEMEDQASPYFLAQGVVVHNCYQEQIMKMAQDLAGYSLGEADLLRRCLSGSTKVVDATTGNLVSLKEIAAKPEYWLSRKVFSLDIKSQKIVQQPIIEIHPNGVRDVWEITTRTNRKIRATNDHLFYTVLGWKPLKNFSVGDRLGLPNKIPINHSSQISDAQIKFTAYLIGDGHLSTKSSACSYFCNSDVELITDFNRCAEELFGYSAPIDQQLHPGQKSVTYVRIGFVSAFNNWVDNHLKAANSRDKEIPDWVFSLSRSQLQLFLGILWSTDGSFDTAIGHTDYNSTSEVLVRQIQHLLLRLGIVSLFNVKTIKYQGQPDTSYRVQITGREDMLKFCELIQPYLNSYKWQLCQSCYLVIKDQQRNQSKHSLPPEIITLIAQAKKPSGMTRAEIDKIVGVCHGTMSSGLNFQNTPTRSLSRHQVNNFATAFADKELTAIANSEVFWDEITYIEYIGKEEVFDLTIPETHNFIANDFIVHNCMGKKKVSEMEKQREIFIDGATKRGVKSIVAEDLFEQMVKFAEYCLSYDTEIMTVEYGSMPIGKIVSEEIECTIYTLDKNGFLYIQPIAQRHYRGQQEVFEYCLENGSVIRGTKDHKFMTTDNQMFAIQQIFEQSLDLKQVQVDSGEIVQKIKTSEKIISRKSLGIQKVYDIGVKNDHNFLLNNGLVASNCFNKSHSTAYAYVAYQTAYLKANYPVEYMAALLTANSGDQDKVQKYIANCQKFDIKVEPPNINRSEVDFTPLPKAVTGEAKDKILFGLSAVKNVGDGAIKAILKTRKESGEFKSLADLCDRVNLHAVNSRALESLIKCGAFDKIEPNRHQLTKDLDGVIKWAQDRNKDRDIGQLSLFDVAETAMPAFDSAPKHSPVKDFPAKEKLEYEKEILGFYVSDHPLKSAQEQNQIKDAITIAQMKENKPKPPVKLVVMLAGIKQHLTKNGDRMAFLQIEDLTGQADAVVFPKIYEEIKELLTENALLVLTGKVDNRDDESQLKVYTAKALESAMADAVEQQQKLVGQLEDQETQFIDDEIETVSEVSGVAPPVGLLEDEETQFIDDEIETVESAKTQTVFPKQAQIIILQLPIDMIPPDNSVFEKIKAILKEQSGGDTEKATVAVGALIVDEAEEEFVRFGQQFWVEDGQSTVSRLQGAGFEAKVSNL